VSGDSAGVTTAGIDQVTAELRSRERFLLTAHEGPDGDALGSLLGMHHLLGQLGKDSVMFMAAKEFPLPIEYRFLPLEEVFHEPPADMADRTVIFLDCGNIDRMPVEFLSEGDNFRINIDHHHDNTLFGTFNLVDAEASCTAEIVAGLLDEAGIPLADGAALALYVGLVTDTGRFQYANTTPRAHLLAARLLADGVQPAFVFSTLFESLPLARQRLLGLALGRARVAAGGRLALTWLVRDDFDVTGADDASSDGVVDALRAIEGVELAALVREPRDRSGPARKISLRSRAGGLDCSAIARERGGGGHPGAAGFSTDESVEEIVAFLERAVVT
jgi:bifunctional oligoribonuclease and PAP phosphatase NrnA